MTKRDLAADLKICEAATPGPWAWESVGNKNHTWALGIVTDKNDIQLSGNIDEIEESVVVTAICDSWEGTFSDAKFIATAREGWPEAIRRAIEAEAEVKRLRQQLAKAEAGAAAMREALEAYDLPMPPCKCPCHQFVRLRELALSSNAGVVMLERMRKFEAVAEVVKSILTRVSPECRRCLSYGDCNEDDKISSKCSIYKLKNALTALEGGQVDD